MKLYDLAASPNTRRVRIYLAEKGIEMPVVSVDMMKGENETPEYLEKNSLGKMPVLELDDGTFLAESAAICRYLEELHPEPPLFGVDTKDRAIVEMWHRRMEHELLLPAIAGFVHSHPMWQGRRAQVPEYGEVVKDGIEKTLDWLDKELEGKDFIAGDRYTVADITAQSAMVVIKAVLKISIPEEMKNLAAWWERVSSRPTARV